MNGCTEMQASDKKQNIVEEFVVRGQCPSGDEFMRFWESDLFSNL